MKAIHLKNVKNRLWKRFLRSKLPYDYANFCQARNHLRSYTRKLRHEFEHEIASDIKHNPKRFWQYTKSRLNTVAKVSAILNPEHEAEVITDDRDRAELFNKYFCSVFTKEESHSVPTFSVPGPISPLENC